MLTHLSFGDPGTGLELQRDDHLFHPLIGLHRLSLRHCAEIRFLLHSVSRFCVRSAISTGLIAFASAPEGGATIYTGAGHS